jgi:hypothetical protein
MGKLPVVFEKQQRVIAGPDQYIQVGSHPGQEAQYAGAACVPTPGGSGLWQGGPQNPLRQRIHSNLLRSRRSGCICLPSSDLLANLLNSQDSYSRRVYEQYTGPTVTQAHCRRFPSLNK